MVVYPTAVPNDASGFKHLPVSIIDMSLCKSYIYSISSTSIKSLLSDSKLIISSAFLTMSDLAITISALFSDMLIEFNSILSAFLTMSAFLS